MTTLSSAKTRDAKSIAGIKNTSPPRLTLISSGGSGDEKRGPIVELMRTREQLKLIGVKEKNRDEREGEER